MGQEEAEESEEEFEKMFTKVTFEMDPNWTPLEAAKNRLMNNAAKHVSLR